LSKSVRRFSVPILSHLFSKPEKSSAVRISILVCGHINAGTCKIWGSQKIVQCSCTKTQSSLVRLKNAFLKRSWKSFSSDSPYCMSLSKCAIHFIVSSWVIYLYLSAVLCSHLEEPVFPPIFRWLYFGPGLASCALLTDRTRCISVPWQKKKSRGTTGVNWGNGGMVELLSSALSPHLYVGALGKPAEWSKNMGWCDRG